MANENERMRIRAARYVPGAAYLDAVERALANLPPRRRARAAGLHRAAAACAALVACALVLVPVVYAAAPLIGRLFTDFAARIEARQALPDGARFTEALARRESWIRTHAASGEATFEGAKITLSEMAFVRADSDADGSKPGGLLELRIRYDRIPAFDPNYIDFSVRYGGRVYAMPADEHLAEYRAEGNRAETIADWRNIGTYGPSGYSSLQAGEPETLLRFEVNPWKLSERTEIVLEGVLDGKLFSLPFTFDPALAHEDAIAIVRASMPDSDERDEALKEYVSALGERAADIGIEGAFRGVRYRLSQLAVSDGVLAVGWTVEREDGDQVDLGSVMLDEFYVDGYPLPRSSSSLIDDRAGQLGLITRKTLARDADNLPPESLIALRVAVDGSGEAAPAVFRYRWAARAATVPKDAAELAAWLAEADALAAAVRDSHPERIRVPIDAAPQTDAAITVSLYAAELTAQGIELAYRMEAEGADGLALQEAWPDGMPRLTVGGRETNPVGAWGQDDESGYFFELPVHYTELKGGAACELTLSVELTDESDAVLRTGQFSFAFALDIPAAPDTPTPP